MEDKLLLLLLPFAGSSMWGELLESPVAADTSNKFYAEAVPGINIKPPAYKRLTSPIVLVKASGNVF